MFGPPAPPGRSGPDPRALRLLFSVVVAVWVFDVIRLCGRAALSFSGGGFALEQMLLVG